MKTVVVYKSKTGFTKKYAQWIAKELSADILDVKKVNVDQLIGYDTIIYGGGLYAGGIRGVKLITQNLDKLKGKKLIVYATGASPSRDEVINEVRNKNFTMDQQKSIKFFYLRGGFDYTKLNPLDKFLMQMMKMSIKRKKVLTPDERGMLAAYEKPVDFTQHKYMAQLINYAK